VAIDGPWFEDLRVGDEFEAAPALTLTDGHAAVHQATLGDRLRVALDRPLSELLTGTAGALAHPALVCDVAIGQSTLATRRVIANLFYRGLVLRHAPRIGDTLRTSTEVVALRQNRPRVGRRATGLAVLRIRTVDQEGRRVLDFWRCAMLPLRDPAQWTGHADDLAAIPSELDRGALRELTAGWDLAAYRAAVPGGARAAGLSAGLRWSVSGGDVVSAAPELARLSLNVATVHHDARAGGDGRRLVYGGHTIGLAAAQVVRALPDLVYVAGWHGCDHLGPVYEGDTLTSDIELERLEPLGASGTLAHLRSIVTAHRGDGPAPVLDWRFVAVAV
jgi:acyl dehydratase